MKSAREHVDSHYGRGDILNSILRALREMGKDVAQLAPADLAPVDEFHIRGREATVELAGRASLKPGLRVLDVGCGLGGSVRYLASEHQCQVVGIDLTKEYVDVANALADLVGLKHMVEFRQGSALDMPFDDSSFDVVWTEHVQMNIANKRAFYAEIARVLAPRGRLLFHDIFQGDGARCIIPCHGQKTARSAFLPRPRQCGKSLENWASRSATGRTRASIRWTGSLRSSRS
jgi:MPBQ/MSBQ methyltransferase